MRKSLLKLVAMLICSTSFVANGGVVVESTRYLYKEGSREISAQLDNKDDTPYLMKSWVEASGTSTVSAFMVTPPLFRLEGKQKNTVRIFPNAHISSAAKDRDTLFYFNVMSIPPTNSDDAESQNRLQLAVRHRMRLIYRPKAIQNLSVIEESKKIKWRKSNGKITIENPTPFFIYFTSVKINGKEMVDNISNIEAFESKQADLPAGITGGKVTWSVATEYGSAGPEYSSSI
ncbi:molecular chaperone [Enterobacteriaceae bacterium RIT814]|uniref:fimbrial biogenesis chaperone n=1 Tax=Leclercia pneumoniae TaxID=2815358 RepID=UPI0021E5BE46|nr:molecular chaperone [Leclercia pneumoniae]MBM6607352.1 molecular chaperone [Enterobacteriaceae bacterium RIT 814]MCV2511551.1 molecular chaperone [Leclercia pneumoniae]WNN81554.1 molecular chaperone [Leclercia pneumoniae]